jgi:hypothetical protein
MGHCEGGQSQSGMMEADGREVSEARDEPMELCKWS